MHEYFVLAREFEHLAAKVLDECHYTHPDNASELLERKCPMWANRNCLEMAAQAQDKVCDHVVFDKSKTL